MISVTITDRSGRTLSGQTIEAFWNSIAHARPLSASASTARSARREMRPYIGSCRGVAPTATSAAIRTPACRTPSASYDETPEQIAGDAAASSPSSGLVNIVGGCCGTTPDHIRAIAEAVADGRRRAGARSPSRSRA